MQPETAELLRKEKQAYFYGNIAADIINIKAWGGHQNHCHRWTIIQSMQAHAHSPAEHAFILGYLSHLAADTIAHNHFVPYHLTRYARSKGLGHLYWEMRADSFVPDSRWDVVTSMKANPELDALDELVNRTVPKKALSMNANKLLFNHVLLISERNQWRRGVLRLHGLSSAPLEEKFLERFRSAAVGRMRLALGKDGPAALLHLDTTGKAAQKAAWSMRKRSLRSVYRSAKREEQARLLARAFLEGMESPPLHAGPPHWAEI